MTLRSKLTIMFFGALQVTFLTAVGTFWAVQSWQLLADELTLTHAQSRRLERALAAVPAADATVLPSRGGRAALRPNADLRSLRRHAQTLEETELIDGFGRALEALLAAPARSPSPTAVAVRDAAQRLKHYYAVEVNRLRERARFVTRLSTALFVAIVTVVLAGMMAYFAAIRVWLVRPIQALGRATRVISTGDLDHRIPVRSHDELGTLAASINTMAASLAEKQRRLVTAERFAMIGEMSAYVAHNIRNPLASIRTTAQAEMLDLPEGDGRRVSFKDIVTAADRLESWVGNLLRFASPVTLDRTRESLNELVERCIALVRPQLAQAGLQLDVVLDSAVQPVPLDRNKIEQVISVVLGNAIDASPAGATIRIASALRPGSNGRPPAVCVRVQDAGRGIPRERLGTVFTLFATTKRSGTGLGLALAHKIVTAHDGTITIGSREGEGTVVEIELPAERSTDGADHPDR